METMYYIGLDVHKKLISYCVKDVSGRMHAQGKIPATRCDLDLWMKTLPQPWTVAMEATIFTAWIYDHLQPHAAAVKVAHPLMLRVTEAPIELFRDLQEITNSIFCAGPSGLRQQMDVWFSIEEEPAPRGTNTS